MAPEGEIAVFLTWFNVLHYDPAIYSSVDIVRGVGRGGNGTDLREGGARLHGSGEGEDASLDEVFRRKGIYANVVVAGSDDDAVVGGGDSEGFGGVDGGGVGEEGVGEGEDFVGARVDDVDGAIPRSGEEDRR